jgi:hypothetical protein
MCGVNDTADQGQFFQLTEILAANHHVIYNLQHFMDLKIQESTVYYPNVIVLKT